MEGNTVGIGWLERRQSEHEGLLGEAAYAWDVRMPVVECDEVLGKGSQDRDLFFCVVVHNLLGEEGMVLLLRLVCSDLLVGETLHMRLQFSGADIVVVGREGAIPGGRLSVSMRQSDLRMCTHHSMLLP